MIRLFRIAVALVLAFGMAGIAVKASTPTAKKIPARLFADYYKSPDAVLDRAIAVRVFKASAKAASATSQCNEYDCLWIFNNGNVGCFPEYDVHCENGQCYICECDSWGDCYWDGP